MESATAPAVQSRQESVAVEAAGLSLKDRIARDLGQRILSGFYPPLTVLPTEAELCIHYGASRTALRDALLTLSAKGLIEARKRAGTRVRPQPNGTDWTRRFWSGWARSNRTSISFAG